MHQTLPSGFQVFRPLTRDFLHGSSITHNNSPRDLFSRPDEGIKGTKQGRRRPYLSSLTPKTGGGYSDRNGRQLQGDTNMHVAKREHVTLPKLSAVSVMRTDSSPTLQEAIKLPDLVPLN